VPYRWGGTNPNLGLDCSGYTQLVYRVVGVRLPRISYQQAGVGHRVSGLSRALPGDLLFFYRAGRVRHVSIYAGRGLMYEAPRAGLNVRLTTARTPTFIRRVL
jgi:peptidoglycan DL-endopeptidase CwlO